MTIMSQSAFVKLRLFSGLPNPRWPLSPAETVRITTGLTRLPLAGSQPVPPLSPRELAEPPRRLVFPDAIGRPRSGYRGFEFSVSDGSSPAMTFHVYRHLVLEGFSGHVRQFSDADEWEKQLWDTAPEEVRMRLAGATFEEVTEPTHEGRIRDLEGPHVDLECEHAPAYVGERDSFNTHNGRNNCYNYATKVLNTSKPNAAIPGRNNDVSSFTMTRLVNALESDDLEHKGMKLPSACPPAGTHYAAIVIREFANGRLGDFHCLRMDRTGRWSHKDGDGPVSNLDDAGERLDDLTRANLSGNPRLAGLYLIHHDRRNKID
jgi:hypothetical protein